MLYRRCLFPVSSMSENLNLNRILYVNWRRITDRGVKKLTTNYKNDFFKCISAHGNQWSKFVFNWHIFPRDLLTMTQPSLKQRLAVATNIAWNNALQWRHNECDGVSNHRRPDCLLNRISRRRSKKTPMLCVNGLCAGKSPVTGDFPAQSFRNAENVSISWRHHENLICAHYDSV